MLRLAVIALLALVGSCESTFTPYVPEWPAPMMQEAYVGEDVVMMLGINDHIGATFLLDASIDGDATAPIIINDEVRRTGDEITITGMILFVTVPAFDAVGEHEFKLRLHGYHLPHIIGAYTISVLEQTDEVRVITDPVIIGIDVYHNWKG